MTRLEIKDDFRKEHPDIPINVVSDITLDSWLEEGDKDFCMHTGCITSEVSFTSTADADTYDLTDSAADHYIDKFYDIDENPGGGVAYDGKRLDFKSRAELDADNVNWRSNASGTPKSYYRRGEEITFNKPGKTAVTIDIDVILYPDAFDNDTKYPFNQRESLRGYSYALVYYLTYRAMRAKKKATLTKESEQDYREYIARAKKKIRKGTYGAIHFRP